MIKFDLILQTNKVLLRPLVYNDINDFSNLTKDESIWKYFTSDLSDKEQLTNWVDEALIAIQNKTRMTFTIIDLKTNKIVGSTSFGNISERDKRIEIGWTWISKDFQGSGINREVKYAMLKYCFETLNLERVEFKTDILNIAARKAMSNIGIIEEGVLRSHTLMTHGRRRDTIYYSLLQSEWNDVKMKNKWK